MMNRRDAMRLGLGLAMAGYRPLQALADDLEVARVPMAGRLLMRGWEVGDPKNKGLILIDPATQTCQKLDVEFMPYASVSPDGQTVATILKESLKKGSEARGLWLIELGDTSRRRRVFDDPNARGAFWSKDGRKLLVFTTSPPPNLQYTHWIVAIDGNAEPVKLDLPGQCVVNDWSPDGRQFLTIEWSGTNERGFPAGRFEIQLRDVERGKPRALVSEENTHVHNARFLPGGREIVYLSDSTLPGGPASSRICRLDLEEAGAKPQVIFDGGNAQRFVNAIPSPDGRRLALMIQMQENRGSVQCWICNADGSDLRELDVPVEGVLVEWR